jgi:inosine-uridine nucleoside N-ribohydrolase
MRHVILDTDNGTDVDDLLALVFLAKAPELPGIENASVETDTSAQQFLLNLA